MGSLFYSVTVTGEEGNALEAFGLTRGAILRHHGSSPKFIPILFKIEDSTPHAEEIQTFLENLHAIGEHFKPGIKVFHVTTLEKAEPWFRFVNWLVWKGLITAYPGFPVEEIWAEVFDIEELPEALPLRNFDANLFISPGKDVDMGALLRWMKKNASFWRLLTHAKEKTHWVIYGGEKEDG